MSGLRKRIHLASSVRSAQLLACAKTSVDALHDPSKRELGLDELTCLVGRFVVDNDNVELDVPRVFVDSRKTPT